MGLVFGLYRTRSESVSMSQRASPCVILTHFMTYFTPDEVTQSYNTAVRSEYMDVIINKVIKSIFEWDVE